MLFAGDASFAAAGAVEGGRVLPDLFLLVGASGAGVGSGAGFFVFKPAGAPAGPADKLADLSAAEMLLHAAAQVAGFSDIENSVGFAVADAVFTRRVGRHRAFAGDRVIALRAAGG